MIRNLKDLLAHQRGRQRQRPATERIIQVGGAPAAADRRVVISFDGTRDGKQYTGHIRNDDGTLGEAVQFRFANDPGVATLLDVNVDHVFAWPAPTWDTDASWGPVGTFGAKYWAILSPWAAMK